MARRGRKRETAGFGIKKGMRGQFRPAPSDPEERYNWAIDNGRELDAVLSRKLPNNPSSSSIRDILPKDSVGSFLHSKGSGRVREIYSYYSRRDIQQAMYKYAVGRKITFLRLFRPQYERIVSPEDILPLALCTLFMRGKYWPSLHGTVSRYGVKGGRICDAVIEIDYKSSWKKCFEMTRPVVNMLRDRGAVFWLKFSGHCSVHVIIPGETLWIKGFPMDHSKFFRCLSDLVKKTLREPRYLDTSFHMPTHFLRLAYSVNENTGLVSLPLSADDYDSFNPEQARPERVKPLPGWWSIPKDAPQRMQDFIKHVMRGQIALSSKAVAIKLVTAPTDTTDIWRADQQIVRQVRQRKRQAAREFLPNEGFYDRMIRLGQDMIDLREFLLLEDHNSKMALRTLKRLHRAEQEIDLSSVAKSHPKSPDFDTLRTQSTIFRMVAKRFDVDEADLKLLWNWDLKERAFRYYERDDIKQVIHALAQGRKVRVGSEDKLVFLQEPADLLPLIVYAHLKSAKARDEYPALYFTNSKYERTGEIPISCDLKIEFSTRSAEESVVEAAMPVFSLLSGFGITFLMLFDGEMGPSIMIPYQAFPAGNKLASVRYENTLARLSPHLKRSMRMPGAACTLVRDPHALSLMPYSIHPQTGLACVPIQFSDLRSFSERDAWLGNVQVDNEWWDVPEDASAVTENFLKQMAPLYF